MVGPLARQRRDDRLGLPEAGKHRRRIAFRFREPRQPGVADEQVALPLGIARFGGGQAFPDGEADRKASARRGDGKPKWAVTQMVDRIDQVGFGLAFDLVPLSRPARESGGFQPAGSNSRTVLRNASLASGVVVSKAERSVIKCGRLVQMACGKGRLATKRLPSVEPRTCPLGSNLRANGTHFKSRAAGIHCLRCQGAPGRLRSGARYRRGSRHRADRACALPWSKREG